jgi:hypothetical protein
MGNAFRITAWNLDLTIDSCFGSPESDNWLGIPKGGAPNEDVGILRRILRTSFGNTKGQTRSNCKLYWCFGSIWNGKISKTRCY